MRKVIVVNFVSLDGYVAGIGNDVMVLPFDPSFDDYNLQRIRKADTLLAGRTTHDQLQAFWVPLADDPNATALQREIGQFNRDASKIAVSDRLAAAATACRRRRWCPAPTQLTTWLDCGVVTAATSSVSVAI